MNLFSCGLHLILKLFVDLHMNSHSVSKITNYKFSPEFSEERKIHQLKNTKKVKILPATKNLSKRFQE